jgi:hypothetical protein
VPKKGSKPIAKYCFAQQKDSSCHIMPFINLSILNALRSQASGKINLNDDASWYTRREWFPETYRWTKSWQEAMNKLHEQDGPFSAMQRQQLQDGIINGNIYKKNGKRVHDVLNPLEKYAKLMLYPFNFTDASRLPRSLAAEQDFESFKTLPLVIDEGQLKCYDGSQHDYCAVEKEVGLHDDWDVAVPIYDYMANFLEDNIPDASSSNGVSFKYFKLNPDQKACLNLPDRCYVGFPSLSILGFDCAYKHRFLPDQSSKHSYYMSSLTQLILFGMGVDRENNPITEDHPDYLAYQEFHAVMDENDYNPWKLGTFNKDNFLEYHLAQLIKQDSDLKKRMQDTVSIFFPTWEYYQKVDQCFDSDRNSLADKKQHLMGEDQYLAYCYTQSARMLWAAATSRRALNAVLELDPATARLLRLPGMPGPNQIMNNAKKKKHGHSFLSVWGDIKERLKQDPSVPNELVSFSSHGMVVSFEEDLLAAQKEVGATKQSIIDSLGFAVIDSYYGDQLRPMYRQANPSEQVYQPCDIARMTSNPMSSPSATSSTTSSSSGSSPTLSLYGQARKSTVKSDVVNVDMEVDVEKGGSKKKKL